MSINQDTKETMDFVEAIKRGQNAAAEMQTTKADAVAKFMQRQELHILLLLCNLDKAQTENVVTVVGTAFTAGFNAGESAALTQAHKLVASYHPPGCKVGQGPF